MVDMPDSFFHKYIRLIINELKHQNHVVRFCTNVDDLSTGDVLFLLGCRTILSDEQLSQHKHSLVIHPSKLPEGKGSAALIWKILEGENTLFISLFEATNKIDGGDIIFQDKITLKGYELSDEIRYKQALKSFELIFKFLDTYPNIKPVKQKGRSSYYPKRTPKDSELDINKSIREQFNLLRVVDNERYPAFFHYGNHRYILKIYKKN